MFYIRLYIKMGTYIFYGWQSGIVVLLVVIFQAKFTSMLVMFYDCLSASIQYSILFWKYRYLTWNQGGGNSGFPQVLDIMVKTLFYT